jgi:Leu/Phe-tRNA-protein transferase
MEECQPWRTQEEVQETEEWIEKSLQGVYMTLHFQLFQMCNIILF